MNGYDYIACFFAGLFLANVVPHFRAWHFRRSFPYAIRPSSGKRIVVANRECCLALFNLVGGYILFRAGKVATGGDSALIVFFTGIAAISTMLSVRLAKKQAE